jgi:DNA/RNA endonuclease YhcR with UshA esterase domain
LVLPVLFTTWFASFAFAQVATVIPDTQAAEHIGQRVTVEGTVVKVFTSRAGNTFLNFGAAYPKQTFTGRVPKDSPVAEAPELLGFQGKKVKITGTVEIYRGKPEIRIMSLDQIAVE